MEDLLFQDDAYKSFNSFNYSTCYTSLASYNSLVYMIWFKTQYTSSMRLKLIF